MWRNEVQFKGNRIRIGFFDPENASVFDAFLALPHAAQDNFFRLESQRVPFPNYRRIATGVAERTTFSSFSGIRQPAIERLIQDPVRGTAWANTCRIAAKDLVTADTSVAISVEAGTEVVSSPTEPAKS